MQQAGHSVLCAPLCLIGKLEWVQVWGDKWEDDVQQEFLQALHYYGCEGYGAVVIKFCGSGFFWYRDYGGSFP